MCTESQRTNYFPVIASIDYLQEILDRIPIRASHVCVDRAHSGDAKAPRWPTLRRGSGGSPRVRNPMVDRSKVSTPIGRAKFRCNPRVWIFLRGFGARVARAAG